MSEETKEVLEEKKWDTEKQRADMERANFLKAKTEKEQIASQLAQSNARISELEKQINANKTEIAELDPLRADVPDLVKQNQQLISELKQLKAGYTTLQELATQFKAKEDQREAEARRNQTIDKVCKPLDEEYGAKYRNKAVKMAEGLVNDGKEEQPQDALDAYNLLRRCYRKLKDEEETKKKESIPTDSGHGAFSFQGADIKEGSLSEVLAQMKKKK